MVKIPSPKNDSTSSRMRERQWGTEKETTPLSHLHEEPSTGAIVFSRLAIVLTVVFWLLYVISVVFRELIDGPKTYQFTLQVVGYVLVVTLLTFSALTYLIARQGAFQRFRKHVRVSRSVLDHYFADHTPSVTVLVPAYGEEVAVVRKTLLSSALQEYPALRVVLLLDDDPSRMTTKEELARYEATLALPGELESLLAGPLAYFREKRERFEQSLSSRTIPMEKRLADLAGEYMWAATWLERLAEEETREDHVDAFFADQVLRTLAESLRQVRSELLDLAEAHEAVPIERLRQLYERLLWIFQAEIAVFERKKYVSLSHEPNKAMNLNSYIGLMGGRYREEKTPEGIALVPVLAKDEAELVIPDSEFLLTLDADSILLHEYCLRLIHFLEQPDNADVGVTQTPYSSFRGAPTRIERLAGATTDIQHIVHQGMSQYGATFWVGANAVIRKRALEEIVESEWVGGYEIKRFVQDHTVIEDTESSIDIALRGWRLVNYPERLSYSATPPDFGSLIIQRRRWANGGLLILPKLWALKSERKRRGQPISNLEFFLRLNYMASIAWSNIGLVFLLTYPYDGRLLSSLVLLSATPYFIAMAIDLKACRYRYTDIIRIYGFNLILLPVNIAGTLKSIEQALSTKKTPFARTPKIKNRTAAGLPYLISPLLIVAFSVFICWRNIGLENWGNAAFAGFNAFAATWAIVSYIGLRHLLTDIARGIVGWLYVEAPLEGRTAKKPRWLTPLERKLPFHFRRKRKTVEKETGKRIMATEH